MEKEGRIKSVELDGGGGGGRGDDGGGVCLLCLPDLLCLLVRLSLLFVTIIRENFFSYELAIIVCLLALSSLDALLSRVDWRQTCPARSVQ
ncbi:hypothetical protein HOY80DRAFT_944078 [Tuber brumale]|nr:hypothetical protein HOY80DRAFT_944078 [Tuber brumale]